MDVILSVRQNISDTFEAHYLLVMFFGIIFYCCDGFFPLHFSAKVNFLMSSDSKSTLRNHLILATLMLVSSFDNVFGGSFPLNVTSISEEPPLFNTNWIWSALIFASFKFRALGKPSSTYISFCIMWLISGNSTAGIRAVSTSSLSDWIPFDVTSNIKMSWSLYFRYLTVVKLILPYVPTKATMFFLQLYKLYIFLMPAGKPISWIDQRIMVQSVCSYHSSPLLRFAWGLY